ncbi:hypothetical protein KC19_5G159600 [Ceratodon purpureus]|uniref:Glycosyltransferase n=1 Tax=Ceratodon purpureus TaxID=3225 RepID=A0A8T0I3G4_CERPU|nr:hypothetical protein KC19_5G159600 [Ceratodon purpureus]
MTEAEADRLGERLQGGHVVVFPFPASGHIAPFIPFARSLARYGVAITFVCPKHELSKVMRSLVEDESFDARENVKLETFEVPIEGGLDMASFDDLKHIMYENVEKFDKMMGKLMGVSRMIEYPSHCNGGAPVCIISDMFLGFTQGTAEKFNIVRYCLFASPVHFLSLVLHLPKFNAEGLIPSRRGASPLMIPNFPPIPPGDLPPSQLGDTDNPGSHHFLLNEAHQLWKAGGLLVNSVGELERSIIEGLQRYIIENSRSDKPPRIWTVGPLVEGLGEGKLTLRQKLRETSEEGECFDWLNKQPDSSVLYICFGTVAMVSDEQIRQMAIAIENSGQRFFWVLRIPKDEIGKPVSEDFSQVFPEGFLERTKARGLVYLDWAPQLHILAHRAVRGFVSHCGWNSTIESISVGVPMIAWPYQAEQMMNATLLDQLLGVAIRINKTGGWRDMITSETFERAIRTLMAEPAGDAMKAKVLQISELIEKAVRPGGSSRTNLESFVQEVRMLSPGARHSK